MSGNPKIVICRNCNSAISKNAIICPHCGAKNKKPFYKRVWFIILAIIVVVGVIGSLGGGGEKIVWDDIILGDMIPEPPAKKGDIHTNAADELWIDINDLSSKQFYDYIEECKEKGYTVDAELDSYSYGAYNAEGYSLKLSHYGDEADMSIQLEAPMQLGKITWPNSTAGNKLPAPKSTTGDFSFEHDDSFFVYVGDMTKDDYNEYVNACTEKGFNVDYNKGDTYYQADDAEGWHISLAYEGNSMMTIRIDAPSEEETTEPENTTQPEETDKPEENEKPEEPTQPEETDAPSGDSGIDPDFKAAMDSYENFMSEYVDFMKKYSANPTDISLLMDVGKYTSDYAEFVANFDEIGSSDMNVAEAAYYLEVQARVTEMLLEVMP